MLYVVDVVRFKRRAQRDDDKRQQHQTGEREVRQRVVVPRGPIGAEHQREKLGLLDQLEPVARQAQGLFAFAVDPFAETQCDS